MDVRADGHPDGTAAQSPSGDTGWWPLNCLRSLGRAATIASGAVDHSLKQHADYRGFRILTTELDGGFGARVTYRDGAAIRMGRQLKQQFDAARFPSHEEAAQHARFVITSGAFSHLGAKASG